MEQLCGVALHIASGAPSLAVRFNENRVLWRAMRQRADMALVERGFFESRARARAAIEAGLVRADGVAVRKPSDPLPAQAHIEASPPHPYVSRGGLKLAAGLAAFNLEAMDKTCLDLGASTGGFCDVLLRAGARIVYAVDVGHGQLHRSLRDHARIVSMEKQDARCLEAPMFVTPPQLIVCDVSFISLKLALPRPLSLAAPEANLVCLVKPQFEAGRDRVNKGIVRDAAVHKQVCGDISAFLETLGWRVLGVVNSPIEGGDGNREFLLGAKLGAKLEGNS